MEKQGEGTNIFYYKVKVHLHSRQTRQQKLKTNSMVELKKMGATNTFMGRGKFWWEERIPKMEEPACWERLAALSPRPLATITITSRSLSLL